MSLDSADTGPVVSGALPDRAPDFDGTQTGGAVNLSLAQAAAFLGVSERTIRRKIGRNEPLREGWAVGAQGGKRVVRVQDARTLTARSVGLSGEAAGQVPDTTDNADTLRTECEALRRRVGELDGLLVAAQERETWLRGRVEAAEAQAAADRQTAAAQVAEAMARIPMALPPARPSWWRRLTAKQREDTDG